MIKLALAIAECQLPLGDRNKIRFYEPNNYAFKEVSDMAKIRPLHDRVIVKRIEEKEQVRGGIIIPDSAKEKPQEGEIIAVGNGKVLDNGNRIEPSVKAGDRILFGKYSGSEIKLDGEEFLILREEEILGVLESTAHSKGKGA
jgi:chaperonin GroES